MFGLKINQYMHNSFSYFDSSLLSFWYIFIHFGLNLLSSSCLPNLMQEQF